MKAIATRTVDSETAINIVSHIIEGLGREIMDAPECHCGDRCCTCAVRYWSAGVDKKGVHYSPDWTGMSIDMYFPEADTVVVESTTCGGHYHAIRINVGTGELRVEHEGARSSFPGTLLGFLPEEWFKLNNCKDWTLIKVQTSEKGWAVPMGLLQGQFGEGPTNAREADEYEASKKFKEMEDLCRKICKDFPEGVGYIPGEGWHDQNGSPYSWKWTPTDYRRAGAMGISI